MKRQRRRGIEIYIYIGIGGEVRMDRRVESDKVFM